MHTAPEKFFGLPSEKAAARLKKFGPNELEGKKSFLWLGIICRQFQSPLVYVLFIAGVITLLLGRISDASVIFMAVFINVSLGSYQEQRAQNSLKALNRLLSPSATVIRDGQMKVIEAKNLVVGDLVVLTIGCRVPADGVLIQATDFSVNEAILTGESVSVKKREKHTPGGSANDLVFAGTIISTGIGKMIVTSIGKNTQIGKIGKRVVEITEQKTPLQIQLGKLAKSLTIIAVGLMIFIFIWGTIRGYGLLLMLSTSVAVAVASIPEGLVVALTVILALGVERILKRKAAVRKLLAAETLGSVSVICADKTGTLTEGKLTVVKAETPNLDLLVKSAVLCNDMRDPLEEAMFGWSKKKLGDEAIKKLKEGYPRLDEIPFSPKTKMIATIHPGLLIVSGAPEVVLRNCELRVADYELWLRKFEEYGEKGYRLVGFAYKKFENSKSKIENSDLKDLTWLGILVYEDPVQDGVKTMLQKCQKAGIKIKVITGDFLPTAQAILKKLDLESKNHSLTGEEMERLSRKELEEKVDDIVLFARINPEQKLEVVKALKARGETVAMMGDGVNDAPALAQADIGIVVNRASDVAVQTADMVLLDSNFATIVHAIEEGRAIFVNIKKVVLYLLSHVFVEAVIIGASIIFGWPLPITAAQIIWINLVEDTLPSISLAFEPQEEGLMSEPPRTRGSPILDFQLKAMVGIIGGFLGLSLLVLSYFLSNWVADQGHIQTIIFVALGIESLFACLACRGVKKSIFSYNPFSNKTLNISLITGFSLLVIAVYLTPLQKLLGTQPLDLREWFFLLSLGMFTLCFIELTKSVILTLNKKWR